MRIGLLGTLINNENLGCVALTYSVLYILEKIGKSEGKQFEYYVFEASPDKQKTEYAAEKLEISKDRIQSFDVTPLFRTRRFLHHFSIGLKTFQAIKSCDIFIDMTGGDSFTDIYGQYTFDSETNVKYLIKRLKKTLILGPQTYGPFEEEKNRCKAKGIIEQADLVIARDQKSADYIASFSNKKVYVTTDVAFMLPYEQRILKTSNKIKVGINVSGLLLSDKTEETVLVTKSMSNYDEYVKGVIDWLLEQKEYDVHIIPHVGKDGVDWVKKQYGNKLNYHDSFIDPIEAKSVISSMDIFIGSRMHATIGSFSTGVATIPVAYSRKFSGLFEHLNYPYVVDLQTNETEKNLLLTKEYIKNYEELKNTILRSRDLVNEKCKNNLELIEAIIKGI